MSKIILNEVRKASRNLDFVYNKVSSSNERVLFVREFEGEYILLFSCNYVSKSQAIEDVSKEKGVILEDIRWLGNHVKPDIVFFDENELDPYDGIGGKNYTLVGNKRVCVVGKVIKKNESDFKELMLEAKELGIVFYDTPNVPYRTKKKNLAFLIRKAKGE